MFFRNYISRFIGSKLKIIVLLMSIKRYKEFFSIFKLSVNISNLLIAYKIQKSDGF